ncbi:MAG: hypothetical protein IMF14_02930 [Proteobacteria bacterium]|nr:hypothetical protein [Pseudomonadota bacterium]
MKSFIKKSRPGFTLPAVFTAILFQLMLYCSAGVFAVTEDDGAFGLTNFAFASYLGTGFYTTSGQKVFVLQLPFEHEIRKKTSTEEGWVLKLPVTIGIINFDGLDTEELPGISDVTTITFLPGIEYRHPVTLNWTLSPFADYGFARDLNNTTNVLVMGTGIKSHFNFSLGSQYFTLGNRLLYARERSRLSSNDSDYTLVETGISYNLPRGFSFANKPLFANIYYINFYYPNNLVFLENTRNPIRIGVEHEFGFTISNIPDFLFFERPQLGLGIRYGNNVKVYRLIFGMPF